MARVDKLERKSVDRPSRHAAVEARYAIFDIAGETILQIETYGSPGREIPGKVSQSVQFGSEGLAALKRILAEID